VIPKNIAGIRDADHKTYRHYAGVMSRIARFIPIAGTIIRTRFDRDVFFSLLESLYVIRWWKSLVANLRNHPP
jgi:hypothetical protein